MTAPTDMMSPLALFLHADIVVKAVMIGLALASIWTWTIIISFGLKIGKIGRDQLQDMAQRRGMSEAELERLLAPNL